MANFGANLELIQIFLSGENEDEIVRLQFLNNQLNGVKYNYTPPAEKQDGSWIVWFYADIKEWKDPKELNEDEIQMLRKFGE